MTENGNYSAWRSMRGLGLFILIAATAVGGWAIITSIQEGQMAAATTQHVPWGLWVAMYIFFMGLSAGAFLLSTLTYVFHIPVLARIGPLALIQALVTLLLGGLLILLDLGHPERIFLVFTSFNRSSVMSWMSVFYNLYLIIVLAELYFAFRPRFAGRIQSGCAQPWLYRLLTLGRGSLDDSSLAHDKNWLQFLGVLGMPLAIILPAGVGLIFAVTKARANWFGGTYPAIFLLSAMVSGAAMLTFLVNAFSSRSPSEKRRLARSLSRLTIIFLLLDALLLLSEILVTFYGDNAHEITTWRLILFGPYAWVFWGLQIFAGLIIPVILVLLPQTRRSVFWLGLANLFIVLGLFATRLNIVIPPLIQPAFDALAGANSHPRYALGYLPSRHEWLVALGVISIGVWISLAIKRFAPSEPHVLTGPVRQGGE